MSQKSMVARWTNSEAGGVGVVLALFLSASVVLSALAVDVASLFLERRTAQGAVDLAALAAASDLDRAEEAARATLAANGFPSPRTVALVKGRYDGNIAVGYDQRFVAGQQPYNAVRLDVALGGQLYFAKSFLDEPEMSVSAIGAADAMATFSIGSRLASVRGGLANAVLGALLGGSVSLSVMDYEALLDAHVSLGDFLAALATEIGVTAGSYDQVLDADVSVDQVLRAAADVATADGQTVAASALTRLAQAAGTASLPLSSLVDLGPLAGAELGQQHAGLGTSLNVMSLVSAVGSLANGDSQVSVNLAGTVPGLLSLTLDLAIGEPAQHSGWVAVGQTGAAVHTAQTRLRLVAEVGGSGVLAGVRVRLPLYIELASAEARLKTLTCSAAGNGAAVVAAKPAVVKAWIGDVSTAGLASFGTNVLVSQGRLVNAPLIQVTAGAYLEMSNVAETDLSFSQADVDAGTMKTAEVRDYASSVVGSLLQSADIQVNVLGLGIGLGSVASIKSLVISLLTPVTALLDDLLAPMLELVGVHLGEVDVQVNGIRCGGAVLAG